MLVEEPAVLRGGVQALRQQNLDVAKPERLQQQRLYMYVCVYVCYTIIHIYVYIYIYIYMYVYIDR